MILTANWDFGITELIQVITAVCTLLAVLVSLYLANRARRIKKKVILSDDGIIRIVNVGDTKFTISAIGYVIGDNLYFNSYQKYLKPLSEERQIFSPSSKVGPAHWDSYFSNVVLEPGECVETKIRIHKNGVTTSIEYIFIVFNYKIYYYKVKYNKLLVNDDENGSIKIFKKNNIFNCFK